MNWYISKIVYEIICGDGFHMAQFDEQLRLVQANNPHEAFELSNQIGQAEAICFQNDKQQLVQWKFIAVPEVIAIDTDSHGAELLSRIREVENANAYREIIFSRANSLYANQPPCQPHQFLT
ncbi:MAG: DUF4288 domain-containing protein [Bacteroidetes bacterium]|nr:DUF4288 domain-containing protein [Bacteroidota bacterium]